MNRSRTSTPIKSPKREAKPIQNVEEEFCKRTLNLMTAFYENLPIAEILNFPPVEKVEVPQEKKCQFNSSIVDLRLKRAQENQQKLIREYNEKYDSHINEVKEMLKSSTSTLDDVFHSEPVDRPPKPLYIMNAEKDKEAEKVIKRRYMKSLNILKMEPIMKERLQESEKRGKERAAWRVNRMSKVNNETKHADHSLHPWKGTSTLKERELIKYKPDGGYPVTKNMNKTNNSVNVQSDEEY